jgi:hypothetical protein
MRFGSRLTSSFYSGAALSSLVPGVYPVSLNGRPYLLDDSKPFVQRTVPLLRQQADASASPGEASINPEDLWRRSVESWHHGAGQTSYDRADSDPFRFRSSKGVDVWTQHALSLLPGTGQELASANTNLQLAVAGSRLYALDGTALKFTTDVASAGAATWTAVTGMPGAAGTSIASDGFNVWTANAANGVYTTNRGSGAAAQLVTTALDATAIVGYVKGRLMVGWKNSLYNITSAVAAALPTALMTQPNTDFVWVGFAEGPTALYAAGYSGDKSLIYRTTAKADATALDAPVVAGRLPDGEIIRAIAGYLGFLLIGSDKGWRLAALSDAGDIVTMSDLIPTGSAVRCFEPQDRFVWYGLTNYDASSTGLGRGDLSVFTKGLNPAYASDLMVTGQGAVLSVVTFQNQRVLAVSGLGIYTSTAALVASGTVDGGSFGYGLSDPKVAMALDVAHEPLLHGAHSAYLAVDGGTFNLIGRHFVGVPEGRFPAGQRSGERFEVRLSLERDGTTTTAGPTLTRWTFLAEPVPSRSYLWELTLLLTEVALCLDEVERHHDVAEEIDDIRSLVGGDALVAFQSGNKARPVFVKDFEFDRRTPTKDRSAWQGSCTVLLKEPAI